jgi:23S rRNA (guanosine2251-2'-O)-methyltransferase
LREKTRDTCDRLVKIPFSGGFGSLNVSNAAAVALYAAVTR